MLTLGLILHAVLFPVLYALYFPFHWRRLRKRGNYREGFGERFGIYGPEKRAVLREGPRPTWVHAVSVGETVAALGFIRFWQERVPGERFVLSTSTSTAQGMARAKAPPGVTVVYCPMDFLPCVASALRVIRPVRLVLFEVEIWPLLILMSARHGIPVSLVNGRMSDRSARGYARWRGFFGPIFGAMRAICVQGEEDARRLRAIVPGSDAVHVCGNMKFDQVPDRRGSDVGEVLGRVFPAERRVWVAASTHAPEEETVTRVFRRLRARHAGLRLILVPRHSERAAEVCEALRRQGTDPVRLTDLRSGGGPGSGEVLVVDTTGELMSFMEAGDVVFMGKSLGDFGKDGGHNIIEPAILGKAVVFGPAMHNFRDVARNFLEDRAAVQVADEAGLERELDRLLGDEQARRALGGAARATVQRNRGAMARTWEKVQGGVGDRGGIPSGHADGGRVGETL